ncbi:MAG: tRNA pseudouridine(38-40) synthase TruA, partial [Muribaculaceae bacterium]|nr:tRNA pseudouridine(38-40) synthase TruA [Muribaculaceae bacterium]
VREDAHARFDAVSRTYKYFVIYNKSPFQNKFTWHSPAVLDMDSMNEAAEILKHTSDFTSFAKLHSDAKTNICSVTHALWQPYRFSTGEDGAVFTISADRFLRNMVRAVVGTLVEVGRHKLDVEGFKSVIEKRDRCAAGISMPASPLFLWDVQYPEEVFLL